MATTTNYGWTTPDDTALVKDGAAAIRSLGSSIDSTLKTQIDAQIPDSLVTTKGDIIAATASSTPARLASSAVNGDVLTVDTSTATGLKWAAPASGGMTLISTTTLSGASIVLSSIPQTYNDLKIVIRNYKPTTDGDVIRLRLNNDTTALRHAAFGTASANNDASALSFNNSYWSLSNPNDNSVANGLSVIDLPDYTNTVTWKMGKIQSIMTDPTTTTQYTYYNASGVYNQTSAITSLGFLSSTSNFVSGTILLYGVK